MHENSFKKEQKMPPKNHLLKSVMNGGSKLVYSETSHTEVPFYTFKWSYILFVIDK